MLMVGSSSVRGSSDVLGTGLESGLTRVASLKSFYQADDTPWGLGFIVSHPDSKVKGCP